MQRTLVLIRALATARRTAADLATIADMPLSASYRWLDYVVAAELPLEQDRSGGAATYWIDPADLAAFFARAVEQPRSRR